MRVRFRVAAALCCSLGVASSGNYATPTSDQYVTTKRTFATTKGAEDLAFFTRYFGLPDPSATHDAGCLDRDLGWALPDKFGIHFPQSYVTADAVGGTSLRDWERERLSAPPLSSAFDDYATSFWVPDLGGHVRAFEEDGVDFAARRVSADGNYAVIVRTPGSGQTLELQSPTCGGCDESAFAPFGPTECARSHELPGDARYYAARWREAADAPRGWANVSSGLAAPLVAQLRVAVVDVEADAGAFLRSFFPDVRVARETDGRCALLRFATSTAPFDAAPAIEGYSLEYAFVENDPDWARYQTWMHDLHAAFVGFGVGYDRGLDYHVKILATDAMDVTRPGVALDAFASLHEARGVPYHAYNVSNPCPGTRDAGPGPTGAMLYSAGPGGVQGVEFWGAIDNTRFADHELFGWNGCSPTMGCETGAVPPMCAVSEDDGRLRARAFHDPGTELATLSLRCPRGVLRDVAFASFGTPRGDCEAGFQVDAACDADASAAVGRACLGRPSCSVPLRAADFGPDPCPGVEKWLAAEASCA